jgi:hypothetical protein
MTKLYAARCLKVDLMAVVLVDDAGRDQILKLCRQVDGRGDVGVNAPTCLKVAWVPQAALEAALGRMFTADELVSQFEGLEVAAPEEVFASLESHDVAGTSTEMVVRFKGRVRFEMDPSEDAATVKTPDLLIAP